MQLLSAMLLRIINNYLLIVVRHQRIVQIAWVWSIYTWMIKTYKHHPCMHAPSYEAFKLYTFMHDCIIIM